MTVRMLRANIDSQEIGYWMALAQIEANERRQREANSRADAELQRRKADKKHRHAPY